MGVSASGKSTIASLLAKLLYVPYLDADDFHPLENISKMTRGIALDDSDRWRWLVSILHETERISSFMQKDKISAIFACSALKRAYRDVLRYSRAPLVFLHLECSIDLALHRIQTRKGHFMKENMVYSQFKTLEPPNAECSDIFTVSAIDSADFIHKNVIPQIYSSLEHRG